MQTRFHQLPAASAGTQRSLRSLHFGAGRSGRKAYVQAALHADEPPPLLVAQVLRERLLALESQGLIEGEIVLVPMANPIGLSQDLMGTALGRFDLGSGLNFNRRFAHLTPALLARLGPRLGPDLHRNTAMIRAECAALLQAQSPQTETEALKQLLQLLAHDADLVLDLHCDHQAVLHVYAGTPQVEAVAPLAAWLGAQALLHAPVSGDEPFDESLARVWWELQAQCAPQHPIDALGCVAATVELRGESEVSQALAEQDAQALIQYLAWQGHVRLAVSAPPPGCAPTPLEGVEPITAPCAGVVVFDKAPGDWVEAGERVAQLVDPLSDVRTPVHARAAGRCFARISRRYVSRGTRLAKIAGAQAYRSGPLLSL